MADPFEALVAQKAPEQTPAEDPFAALVAQKPADNAPQAQLQAQVDPFEALVSSAPEDSAQSFPVGEQPVREDLSGLPIEEKAKRIVVENIPDSMKYVASEMGDYLHRAGIDRALEYLSVPQRIATAIAIKSGDITGLTPGLQDKLNPTGSIMPKGLSPSDVMYEFFPDNRVVQEKAQALAESFGIKGTWAGESARLLYAVDKGLLGMVADFALDPINLAFAGAGKVAEAAAKAGKMGMESAVAQKAIKAAASGSKAAEELPIIGSAVYAGKSVGRAVKDVGQGSVDVWNSLLPYTRIKDLDENWILHSAMSKGVNPSTVVEVYEPIKRIGVTSSEGSILFDAMENITNAASKDDLVKAIGKAAQKSKVSIPEARADQLADVGQHLRSQLEKNVEREIGAGVRLPGYGNVIDGSPGKSIRAGIIEGYVPHRMSDQAVKWAEAQVKSGKNPKEIIDKAIAEEMTQAGIEVSKGTTGSWVSDFDVGRYERKLRMPVRDANEYIKNKVGVEDFFVSDPIAATAKKIAETKKLALDKGLLETVKKYGVSAEKARAWKPIPHQSLSITEGLHFPPEIADKIGYYLQRDPGGRLLQRLDQYQWLFKRFALAKPDYYLQNIGENAVKSMAMGATPRDFAYVTKVMSGKGGIPIKAGKSEKLLSSSELRKEIVEYGIDSGGIFKEGIDSFVNMGQKMTRDGVLKRTAGYANPMKVINGMMEFGERGENWSRRAFYISLRRGGMAPKDAAMTVERVLFDYGRVTPNMNVARRFIPFIQPVIKTAAIAPELIKSNPKLYNFLNNNMFQTMQAAFNDDTTNSELMAVMGKAIAPRYRQLQDPTFSALLPGNSWIGKYLVNQGGGVPNKDAPWQGHVGGNVMLQFKAPIQFDILNQMNIFDESIMTGVGAGPVLRAFSQLFTGKDVFTDKDIDVTKDHADIAARLSAAGNTLLQSAVPFPNAIKEIAKVAKIGDTKWIEPTTVQFIHGTVGRFATVTNLDKDFFFKMLTMKKYHEQLTKEFISRAAAEGRKEPAPDKSNSILSVIRGWVRDAEKLSQSAFSSARARNLMQENANEMQRVNMSRAGIIGAMTPVDILKNIRMLEKNVKELNKSYQTTSEYRLKAIGEAKLTLDQLQGKLPEESDSEALSGGDASE